MSEITKVLARAKAEVGYLEKKTNSKLDNKTANAGSNNYTKYARDLDKLGGFYNGKKQGYAWCDMFVDWCFVKTFGVSRAKELLCQPSKSAGAGCEYSMKYYKKHGQFCTKPKKGDQIFFKSGSKITHTGLVYKVDSTYVYTYEGNTSSASGVVANGGSVNAKKYKLNSSSIAGYGRPNYKKESAKKTTTTKTSTTKTSTTKTKTSTKTVKTTETAKKYSKSLSGTYKVKSASGLNIRNGAGTNKSILVTIPNNTQVKNYGYYTNVLLTKWLYVQFTYKNVEYTGFASKKYLSKCK